MSHIDVTVCFSGLVLKVAKACLHLAANSKCHKYLLVKLWFQYEEAMCFLPYEYFSSRAMYVNFVTLRSLHWKLLGWFMLIYTGLLELLCSDFCLDPLPCCNHRLECLVGYGYMFAFCCPFFCECKHLMMGQSTI